MSDTNRGVGKHIRNSSDLLPEIRSHLRIVGEPLAAILHPQCQRWLREDGQASDLAALFRKPDIALGTNRDAMRFSLLRGNGIFRDHTTGGDASNLVAAPLREP